MARTACLVRIAGVVALLAGAGICVGAGPGKAGVAWGKPADGIALGLSVSTEKVGYGEDFAIMLHVRNASDRPIRLISLDTAHSTSFGHYHRYLLQFRSQTEEQWQWIQLSPAIGQGPKTQVLPAGATHTLTFRANKATGGVYGIDGKVYVATWPLMPGRYVVQAMLAANGHMTKAKQAGLWTSRAVSGQVRLAAAPMDFLRKVKNDPKVTQEHVDAIYRKSIQGGFRPGPIEELIRLGDRKACRMLMAMLRIGRWTPGGLEFLAETFGDEITYDLMRASHAMGAKQARAAGSALGRLGTAKTIAAVGDRAGDIMWGGQLGFIAGLGQSSTAESLALLKKLALGGSVEAVVALKSRPPAKAEAILLAVMQRGRATAQHHAARVLAGRGSLAAVRWLAGHWGWLNAAAFLAAPVAWPAPVKGMIPQAKALVIAQQALPVLQAPQARYLDGRWYVASVRGHPQIRGRFSYVILHATTGKVLARDDLNVLR